MLTILCLAFEGAFRLACILQMHHSQLLICTLPSKYAAASPSSGQLVWTG